MKEPKGVHVRLLDGSEDIYENVRLEKDDVEGGYLVLHDYAITAKGFLIVIKKVNTEGLRDLDIREAVYAPGRWVSVRSESRHGMELGEPGEGPAFDV